MELFYINCTSFLFSIPLEFMHIKIQLTVYQRIFNDAIST